MAKRALLVGINRYKIPGADLRGCVNDVKNMRSVLSRYYGFADKDIRTLTDLQATKKAMQSEITRLIGKARAGDVLLFHYSGHGSNVPDKNGDEADARDEILCPTDLDWLDPLLDDWLRVEFDKLPAGVNFTVIMDCCHSGTNTRAIQPPDAKRIERFLPCPLDLLATESGRRLRGTVRGLRRELRTVARRGDIVCHDEVDVFGFELTPRRLLDAACLGGEPDEDRARGSRAPPAEIREDVGRPFERQRQRRRRLELGWRRPADGRVVGDRS